MSSSIICQQCKEPLQLDASLVDLTPSAYDMVAASLPQPSTSSRWQSAEEKLAHLPAPASSKQAWQQARGTNLSSKALGKQAHNPNVAESFVVLPSERSPAATTATGPNSPASARFNNTLGDSQPAPTVSHKLRSTVRLHNLLSSRTDIDHPLCSECTQILQSTLQKELVDLKKERDGYIAFEKEVKKEKERESQGMSQEQAEREIQQMKAEEKIALEKLREAEREKALLDEELERLELEERALEEEEAEFWRLHNEHLLATEQYNAELASLRAAYANDVATLAKLEKANVYNDAFCIGNDPPFGTINGLRLGRVAGIPVEWAEINAAWGQTLLLLYTIARKLNYTFESYKLVPMGSFSKIEKTVGDKAVYELYGSGDQAITRMFNNRRFDVAMVAFLDCLKRLMDHVKQLDPKIEFPHVISKDKIGDVSVKAQFGSDEQWTKALRYVLLACKILLKYISSTT